MTRIPQFQQNQAVAPAAVPSPNAGQGLTALAGQLQQFSQQQLVQQQVQKATTAGELAGQTPGFQPTTGGGEAQQAFNEAALASNKQMIATDVMTKDGQLKQQAIEDNPDAAVAYQQYQQLSSQNAQTTLSTVPLANRAYATNLINHTIGMSSIAMQQRVITQQKTKAAGIFTAANLAQTDNINKNMGTLNWNLPQPAVQQNVDSLMSLEANKEKGIELAIQGGTLKPEEGGKMIAQSRQNFRENLLLSQFQSSLHDGSSQNFLNNLHGKLANSGLSELQQLSLATKLKTASRTFAGQNAQQSALLAQNAQSYIFGIQHGQSRNVRFEQTYATSVKADKNEAFQNQVEDAQAEYTDTQALLSLPLANQGSALAEIKPTDTSNPQYGRQLKVWQTKQKMVTQANHQISQDPMAYFMLHPNVMQSLNQASQQSDSGVNFANQPYSGFRPAAADPMGAALAAQSYYGVAPNKQSLLTNPAARGMVNHLNSISPMQRVQQFAAWQQQYGTHFPIVVRNLMHQGKMKSGDSYLIGAPLNDPRLPDVVQAANTSEKELEKAVGPARYKNYQLQVAPAGGLTGDFASYVNTFQNFKSQASAKYIANTRVFTSKLGLSIMANDSGISAADAWTKATDFITGRFNFETIDNSPVRIPKQYSPDVVTSYAKERKKDLRNYPFPIAADARGLPNARQMTYNQLIAGGHYATNSENTGLVWVNHLGSAVGNGKGGVFTVLFKNAIANAQTVSTEKAVKKEVLFDAAKKLL